MRIDRIREAQDRIDAAHEELRTLEARLLEIDELYAELRAPVTLSRAHEILQICDQRDRRRAEMEVRGARCKVRDAKRALLQLRWARSAA
jgi:hypothetical protein